MYTRIQQGQSQVALITGSKGKYDKKVHNLSVRYGRNAVNNFKKYLSQYNLSKPVKAPDLSGLAQVSDDTFDKKMKEFDKYLTSLDKTIKKMPPIQFEYRYLPQTLNGIDTMALMGASYEELGKKTSVSVSSMTDMLQKSFGQEVDARVVDLNQDDKIDIAEYATTILVADKLSSPDNKTIDGVINNTGQNRSIAYANKKNYDIANRHYQALYETYNLASAQKKFLKDKNNLVK